MSVSPFPPTQPMPSVPQPNGGAFAQSGANFGGTPMSAGQTWLFNQSGMVVILSLGLLGVWWVGRDHLSEFKTIRAEEKIAERAERKEFISALEACCKNQKPVAFGSGQ